MIRDLLLGFEPVDIDIVVEEDIGPIADRLNHRLKGECRVHPEFGTAAIRVGAEQIDLARSRTETYPRPAQLPQVRFSDLSQDLLRRDFTVNAIAFSLNKKSFGRIIDPFSGIRDIRERTIRILHPGSFIDDPTRIFRALRYKRRLGFRIDPLTGRLMRSAIRKRMIERLSAQRVINELKLIVREKEWRPILGDLASHRILRFSRRDLDLMERLGKFKIYYLLGRTGIKALPLNRKEAKLSAESVNLRHLARRTRKLARNHELYRRLSPLEPETVALLPAVDPALKDRVKKFLRLKKIKPVVTGQDLKRLGLKPGPLYREILQRLFFLQLDGKLRKKGPALKNLLK
jgi:tRNA nucleotidyltransferase/poly(A) polymerase